MGGVAQLQRPLDARAAGISVGAEQRQKATGIAARKRAVQHEQHARPIAIDDVAGNRERGSIRVDRTTVDRVVDREVVGKRKTSRGHDVGDLEQAALERHEACADRVAVGDQQRTAGHIGAAGIRVDARKQQPAAPSEQLHVNAGNGFPDIVGDRDLLAGIEDDEAAGRPRQTEFDVGAADQERLEKVRDVEGPAIRCDNGCDCDGVRSGSVENSGLARGDRWGAGGRIAPVGIEIVVDG